MKLIDTNKLNLFWRNGVRPIAEEAAKKLSSSNVVNNLLTTKAGFALDARQGKVLQDQVDEIKGKLKLTVSSASGGLMPNPDSNCFVQNNKLYMSIGGYASSYINKADGRTLLCKMQSNPVKANIVFSANVFDENGTKGCVLPLIVDANGYIYLLTTSVVDNNIYNIVNCNGIFPISG